jgi:hypothetical protein
VEVAEDPVAGADDRRGFALDEDPEGIAVSREDGVDDRWIVEGPPVRSGDGWRGRCDPVTSGATSEGATRRARTGTW